MLKKYFTISLLFIIFSTLTVNLLFSQDVSSDLSTDSRSAFDFTTELLDGSLFTFSEYINGKPSVLLFWSTWAAECATCLSDLQPLVLEYADKVNFIAVNCSETRNAVAPFVEKQGFSGIVCLEKEYAISSLYDVYSMPQLILINKDGTIALRNTGMLPENRFKRFLTSMLRR